jgi:hypothetical protein
VANLPPVSTTLVKLVAKFAASVADTGGRFATSVVDTCGAPLLVNISANFQKNLKRSYWDTLGLGGNWFKKKTRSKKSRDTVPLTNSLAGVYIAEIWLARCSPIFIIIHEIPISSSTKRWKQREKKLFGPQLFLGFKKTLGLFLLRYYVIFVAISRNRVKNGFAFVHLIIRCVLP